MLKGLKSPCSAVGALELQMSETDAELLLHEHSLPLPEEGCGAQDEPGIAYGGSSAR